MGGGGGGGSQKWMFGNPVQCIENVEQPVI